MKTPRRLEPLIEDGLIDEVVRPLMSGKEASVYVVRCGDSLRCAKVYKEANKRSFRQAAEYQEGRKVRNSRQARAMAKGSKYGRREQEEAWQNAEVAALFRLAGAGVRVPKPYDFLDGVLLMELVADADGDAAPRLNDVTLEPDEARRHHAFLIRQIVAMLCAGLVHGDLSEFNVLLGPDGPVIILYSCPITPIPKREPMEDADLQLLTAKFDQLLQKLEQLKAENRLLRANEKSWREERAHLIEKNEMARHKVEAMILRLKALEQDT